MLDTSACSQLVHCILDFHCVEVELCQVEEGQHIEVVFALV